MNITLCVLLILCLVKEKKIHFRLHMYVCIYIPYYVFVILSIKTTHPLMTNALLKVTSFSSIK